MEIFKLYGSVFLKSDEADKRLDRINKKGKDAGLSFKKMGKMAMVAGGVVAAGVAAGVGAITGLAIKTGEAADRLLDLNSITGMTTDSIQAWENATVQAGVSADAMTNASQNLTKSMDIITTTGGKGAEAIQALGLSVDQISAMTADERLNTLTEALAGVDDKTVRAKLGTDLFKSSWQEIAPVIDLGVKGMKEAKANANIISNDDLQKANEFRIAVDNMKKRLSVLGMELGVKFMPVARTLFGWFEMAMPYIEKAVDKTFGVMSKVIKEVSRVLFQFQHDLDKWLWKQQFVENSIFDSFNNIKDVILNVINYIVENIMPPLIEIFNFIKDEVVPKLVEQFKAWWPQIAKIIKSTWELIKIVLDLLLKYWNYVFPFIKAVTVTVFDVIKDVISGALKILGGLIDFIVGVFTGDWKRAWGGIKDIFVGIWDIVASSVKGAINIIIDYLNFFVSKANKIINKMNKVPKINLPNIPTIPKLAEGGTITGAGTVMVGEEGPEFLNLPKGASVVPLNKAGNGGITVNINGATVFGDEDADKLGDLLVDRLRMLGVT